MSGIGPLKLCHLQFQCPTQRTNLVENFTILILPRFRDIFLISLYTLQIADFGLSRDLYDGNYYVSRGGMIPVKWTAPEALYYRKYSTASDIWSYGCLLYEIWSLGIKPFFDLTNKQVS